MKWLGFPNNVVVFNHNSAMQRWVKSLMIVYPYSNTSRWVFEKVPLRHNSEETIRQIVVKVWLLNSWAHLLLQIWYGMTWYTLCTHNHTHTCTFNTCWIYGWNSSPCLCLCLALFLWLTHCLSPSLSRVLSHALSLSSLSLSLSLTSLSLIV